MAVIDPPEDAVAATSMALDATGGRLAVAWLEAGGTIRITCYEAAREWQPIVGTARGRGRRSRDRLVPLTPSSADAVDQAVGIASAVVAKIETWASSGSITPMTFWRVRRWTHDPQLSK